ncbi:MAG: hypothetical protein CMJ31_07475 [Phycisphaerae bacterium]|nr:hypothetical protein [Phycisphaerae bacterium]
MSIRRVAARIARYGAAGVMTALGLAVATFVIFGTDIFADGTRHRQQQNSRYNLTVASTWYRDTVFYRLEPSSVVERRAPVTIVDASTDYREARTLVPRWLSVPRPTTDGDDELAAEVAEGFPLPMLRSTFDIRSVVSSAPQETVGVEPDRPCLLLNVPWATHASDTGQRVVPLRPIPAGLAANIAIFAAGWWLLFTGVRCTRAGVNWTRSALRRRKGRCTACGYDLTALDVPECPECGHLLRPVAGSDR